MVFHYNTPSFTDNFFCIVNNNTNTESTAIDHSLCDRCVCNIDEVKYELWYNDIKNVPYRLHVELTTMMHQIGKKRKLSSNGYINEGISNFDLLDMNTIKKCLSECCTSDTQVNEKKKFVNEFNQYVSIEDYMEIIDIISRIKILLYIDKRKSYMPEFYINDHPLTIRKMRKPVIENENNTSVHIDSCILSTDMDTIVNNNKQESDIYWGIFYEHKPLATFNIHQQSRTVYIKPILTETFEVVSFMIY